MSEYKADELVLTGRLQILTAIYALAYTGVNPFAKERFKMLLVAHDSIFDDQNQTNLSVLMSGPTVEKEKNDILKSLTYLVDSEHIQSEIKIAAEALREILQPNITEK